MSKPKLHSRENTALKLKGAGDSIRANIRSSERVPVPSSRKFTATPIRDESVQLKLKKALDDIDAKHSRLKKAKSVAEITPTKSKNKRPKRDDGSSSVALHATPRPPPDDDYDVKKTPSGRDNEERRLKRLVYERMLLFVWRRNKTRQAILSESLRRRQDQILQLEKQIDCLKDLTQSECSKRHQIMNDCQNLENILQTMRKENENLQTDKRSLETEMCNLRSVLETVNIELENMKNDVNSKNIYLKRLENEIQKEQILLKNLKDEKASLITKMKAQDIAMKLQDDTNEKLNEKLKNTENQLENAEIAKKTQICNLNKLSDKYQQEVKNNDYLKAELNNMRALEEEMTNKIKDLEEKLININCDFSRTITENEQLKQQIINQKYWWESTKNFLAISWGILQNAAYIMLPAL